ncbi:MAG: hypothetical protein R2729_26850 [Bryobacteraceae bacterium]
MKGAPWYVWCAVAATTSAMIGIQWDISWHRTIGRDTFWTPAHMAIHLCGVLAGISCGYLILATTFARGADRLREASVRIWGFRGPLGAFVAAWGGIAMLTSAPFDNWWHDAYGLDVKIISPPHMVLAAGMFAVQLGAVLLVLAYKNNTPAERRGTLDWLYLFTGGLVMTNMMVLVMEYTFRSVMHTGIYYRSIALVIPMFLVALSQSARVPWAATKISLIYFLFCCGVNWTLEMFPGEPKLGPVTNPVTHFVPGHFPILLFAPAFALDLLFSRTEGWPRWRRGFAGGVTFMSVLFAVQWMFGYFLMTPWSRNWVFHTHLWDYRMTPNSYAVRNEFMPWDGSAGMFALNLALAFVISFLLVWRGLAWSGWLQKVRR